MSTSTQKRSDAPKRPTNPGDTELDVDDAQIESPKDDAFKKNEPNDDNTASRPKERDRGSKEFEENLEPFHYRG
jgi:hypothetical protein